MENRKATLKARAKLNQTFTDTWQNFTDTLKQLFIPIAQGLQEALGGPLIDFVKKAKEEGWFTSIRDFGRKIVDFGKEIGGILNTVTDTFGAKGILATVFLGSAALWAAKGVSLGLGFNSVASVGGGVLGGAKTLGKNVLKGGALALGGLGVNYLRGSMPEENQQNNGGKLLGVGSSALTGAAYGSILGTPGMVLGGAAGGLYGAYNEFLSGDDVILKEKNINKKVTTVNDGIIKFNPKDKFIGIGDDTLVAGTDAGGNRALANKMSSGTSGGKTEVIHKHEPMKITFEFIGLSESTARDLLSNSRFIKDMNSRLNEVSSSVFSGGKISPNPKFSN